MKIQFEVSIRSVWSFFLLIAFSAFVWIQFDYYIEPGFETIISFTDMEIVEFKYLIQFMWIPIIAYSLMSVWVCILINVFKKLKEFKERGIIYVLSFGLVISTLLGSVVAIISGGFDLPAMFLVSLALYVISGFGIALILGLIREFRF